MVNLPGLLWLLGSAAWAAPSVPVAPEPTDPESSAPAPVEPAETEAAPASPDDLLHLANERMRHGDFEGVRLLAEQVLQQEGEHHGGARYLIAMSYELGGDPARALTLYDALVADSPVGQVSDDLRFRRAECLGRLQRYEEARKELAFLSRGQRPPLDQLKIDVLLGTWELELGRTRKGYRLLGEALARTPPEVGPYYQALARHALLEDALQSAAVLRFEGSDRAKKRALERRAALIEVGNEQLAGIIRTEQVDLALDGFLKLGQAHAAIARDMLDESPLKGLTEEQRALNRQLLGEQVEGIFVKATLYYDRALQLAAKMDWTGEPVPTIRAEYDALVAEVDSLSP